MASSGQQSARHELPRMIYDLLEDMSEDPKLEAIVSWMPHGRAFKVHNPELFESNIMPDYFIERYTSFRYLLEQWGFHKMSRGKDRGAYYHVYFIRGKRSTIANATKRYMLDAMPEFMSRSDEPDLYSMPVVSDEQVVTKATASDTVDDQSQKRKAETEEAPEQPSQKASKPSTVHSMPSIIQVKPADDTKPEDEHSAGVMPEVERSPAKDKSVGSSNSNKPESYIPNEGTASSISEDSSPEPISSTNDRKIDKSPPMSKLLLSGPAVLEMKSPVLKRIQAAQSRSTPGGYSDSHNTSITEAFVLKKPSSGVKDLKMRLDEHQQRQRIETPDKATKNQLPDMERERKEVIDTQFDSPAQDETARKKRLIGSIPLCRYYLPPIIF